jgi:putative flippase GtrA
MKTMTEPPNRILLRQFIQYAVVGGAAFLVDFGSLAFLTERIGLHYLVSASIAFVLGLATNYALCIRWVFDHRAIRNPVHEFAIFSAIGILSLATNDLIMYLLTGLDGLNYLLSKVVAAGLILLLNFSLRRAILFSERGYSA